MSIHKLAKRHTSNSLGIMQKHTQAHKHTHIKNSLVQGGISCKDSEHKIKTDQEIVCSGINK